MRDFELRTSFFQRLKIYVKQNREAFLLIALGTGLLLIWAGCFALNWDWFWRFR